MAFSKCMYAYSLTFCILHILYNYNKTAVFVYNHNYLYEGVMPPFPNSTCFFQFQIMFGMSFVLIFCILMEVELSAIQFVPGLLEIFGIECNEKIYKVLKMSNDIHTQLHMHTNIHAYGVNNMVHKCSKLCLNTHRSL